ncbi:MAG: DEAD/DEAH box helicase family protein [Oscillospiraceae bacterium]|nr:DEAD/DEAH box helicase family protein [Oscillospiraceae bacterium]
MELRPYQQEAREAVERDWAGEFLRTLLVLPTGCGKTIVFCKIIEDMRGLLEGDVQNYDGQTDMVATSTKTFEQGVVVVSRMQAWVEKDFSHDITGGVDFMDNVAQQVVEHYQDVDQDTLLAVLKGVFAMKGAKGAEFVKKHTYTVDGPMEATTLNSATAQACGDRKKKFAMVFMHSVVATNLENMNLITHLKYTDKDGVTRDLELGTWNGKLVIVDDSMPVEETEDGTIYTSYVLGEGAIDFEDIGAKVPYEMGRDPAKNGGQDTLYTRQRKVFSPKGISYEKKVQASLSPTDAELANGENWDLVHSGEAEEAQRSYIADKVIPIARIRSKG